MREENPQSLEELRVPPAQSEGEQLREEIANLFKIARQEEAITKWADGLSDAEEVIQLINKRLDSVELPVNDWTNEDMIRGWSIAIKAYRKVIKDALGG